MTGSLILFDTDDRSHVEAFVAGDPYALAGLFDEVRIEDWKRVIDRDPRVRYWLFKSEPNVWSWDDQVAKGDAGEEWDGVRNYQARNLMREMALGDRGFFYHSQTEKAVVGRGRGLRNGPSRQHGPGRPVGLASTSVPSMPLRHP